VVAVLTKNRSGTAPPVWRGYERKQLSGENNRSYNDRDPKCCSDSSTSSHVGTIQHEWHDTIRYKVHNVRSDPPRFFISSMAQMLTVGQLTARKH